MRRFVVPATALALAVAACSGAEPPLGPKLDRPQFNVSALAGLSGRIAWNTDRDGGPDQDIWIMNADGSRAIQLTANSGIDDGSPTWSPGGDRIAFHSTRDGDYEVFIMNADGSGVTQLTDNASADMVPAWSPDGNKLVFASDRDGDLEVFIMNADGTGVSQVTYNTCSEYNPAWSPGGERIAFRSDCDGDWEIYVMGVDGTAVTQLTDNTTLDDSPAWSSDGQQMAFASDRDGDWEIYVMNVDGSAVTQLTDNVSAADFIPAWSPDGKHLAFTSNRDGDFELFVINADGTGVTQLTNDGFADFGLAWTAGTITGPTNDVFSGATVVTDPFSEVLNTTGATTDADDAQLNASCGAPATDASVWYAFTPAADAVVVVDVSQSDYSAGVLVGVGTQGNLSLVTCGPGAVSFWASAGNTYYVLAIDDQYDGVGNGGLLNISFTALESTTLDVFTVDRFGYVNAQTGIARISGTYACSHGDYLATDVSARQNVGRFSIMGSGYFYEYGTCDGATHNWAATIFPWNGKFAGGKSITVTFAYTCGAWNCAYGYVERTVFLRGGKK